MDIDPRFRQVATDLAKQAGEIMLRYFQRGIEVTTKDNDTPLTIADTAINDLVVETIHREFPNHGIIAEEGGTDYADQEFAWVCDPIDGTISFARHIPTSAFSLALVQGGKPVLGVAYDPNDDGLYVAEAGRGTTLNGTPIRVNGPAMIRPMVGNLTWVNNAYATEKVFPALIRDSIDVMYLHSNVYMGILVARGDLDGLVFPGLQSWDCAALKVIIEEAGGKVTDLFGNEQRYDGQIKGMIASNGLLHDRLVELVRESGALDG